MKLLSLPRRFLVTAVLSATILVALPFLSPAHAETGVPWRDASFGEEYDASDLGAVNQGAYFDRSIKAGMASYGCQIAPVLGVCTNDPSKLGALYKKSAIGAINNSIIALYQNQPAYFALWLRDTGETLGFRPKSAYAQGIGFTGLSMLLPIWKIFRNIAYLLVALAMIAVGFMVMMRKKIDPKTVVTVQNALPRIVITLILITFSYAIAGLLIDVMYVVFSLVITLLVQAYPNFLGPDTLNKYLSGGLATAAGALFSGGWSSVDDLVKLIFYGQEGGLKWWLVVLSNVASLGTGFAAQYILVWFIVSIALLFGYVRILFLLLSAYIQLIISVIIAPFQMLIDVFPGGTGFSSWIKNYVANLSVFPITAGMLLIGTVLTKSNVNNIWTPPLLGAAGETTRGIVGLIGLGVLLTIPSVANAVKEALKTKGAPVGFGGAIGAVSTVGGLAVQYGMGKIQMRSLIQNQEKWQKAQDNLASGRGGAKER